mmetsp:Transcript_4190/g.4294  ORF Transcript_4190/g.4294 Transcript_4190/m.4294 type:complete len:82 (-) Transcript_4190:774-1019(-)
MTGGFEAPATPAEGAADGGFGTTTGRAMVESVAALDVIAAGGRPTLEFEARRRATRASETSSLADRFTANAFGCAFGAGVP